MTWPLEPVVRELRRGALDPIDSEVRDLATLMKPGYDYADEFEFGLDIILEGLEEAVDTD